MKKYISIALLIVLTVSLLAGCRKNVGEETLTGDTTPSGTTTTPSSTATTPTNTTNSGNNENTTNTTTGSNEKGRNDYPSMIMD